MSISSRNTEYSYNSVYCQYSDNENLNEENENKFYNSITWFDEKNIREKFITEFQFLLYKFFHKYINLGEKNKNVILYVYGGFIRRREAKISWDNSDVNLYLDGDLYKFFIKHNYEKYNPLKKLFEINMKNSTDSYNIIINKINKYNDEDIEFYYNLIIKHKLKKYSFNCDLFLKKNININLDYDVNQLIIPVSKYHNIKSYPIIDLSILNNEQKLKILNFRDNLEKKIAVPLTTTFEINYYKDFEDFKLLLKRESKMKNIWILTTKFLYSTKEMYIKQQLFLKKTNLNEIYYCKPNITICCICQENSRNALMLKCYHYLCLCCLNNLILNNNNNISYKCPLCRKNIILISV